MPSLDGTMIAVGFGEIEASFPEASSSTLSWVFTGYSIALTSLVVATGRIGDRRGRRQTFMAGLVLFAVGAAIGAAAPTAGVLIAGRVVQGTGHAFLMPSSMGLILAAWPAHDRTTAIAAWVAVGGVAAAVGPTVGALIFEGPGWRAAFLLHVVTGTAAFFWARRALPDTPHRTDVAPPDPVGIVLVSALLGLSTLAIVEGNNWGWLSPATLTVLGLALFVLAPLFWWRSRESDAPVIDPDLLQRASFRRSLLVSLIASMALVPNLIITSQFVQDVWDFSVLEAGAGLTPIPVLAAICSPMSGRLVKRWGHRNLIVAGVGLSGIGFTYMAMSIGSSSNYWGAVFPGLVLAGMGGWGMAIPMLNGAAVRDMSDTNFGVGTAVLMTCRQAGGVLGIALFFGFFADAAAEDLLRDYRASYALLAVVAFVSVIIALRLPGIDRGEVAEQSAGQTTARQP